MIGVIILAVIVAIVVGAFLWINPKRSSYVLNVPTRVECERCGVVRVTNRDKRTYTFPSEKDRVTCRATGHSWSKVTTP